MNDYDMAPLSEIIKRVIVYGLMLVTGLAFVALLGLSAAGFVGWVGQ